VSSTDSGGIPGAGFDFTDTFVGGSGPAPVRRTRRRLLAGVLALIVVAGAAGIAVVVSGSKSAAAATAVIDSVNSTMADRTAHISMNLDAHTPSGTLTGTGTGAIDFNQSALQLQLSVGADNQQIQMQAVYLAGSIYESIPDISQVFPGKSWVSVDLSSLQGEGGPSTSSLGTSNNPAAMLQLLAQQGNTVVPLGSSTVDGVSVQGYSVALNSSAIKTQLQQAKLPSWMTSALANVNIQNTSVTVYVDSSGLLRRMAVNLSESLGSSGSVSVDESLDFSDYGAPVSVSAPPADQVVSLQQLLQAAQSAGGANAPT
jgi:hypothetical protein